MRVVHLEQSGPEWLQWRQGGLGGSDATAVVGDVDWLSREELLQVKLGQQVVEENWRMKRGKRLEPRARRLYEALYGYKMPPACVEHSEHPWLRASLDGLRADHKLVLEIKAPSQAAHDKALSGVYPTYYKAQIYQQVMVSEVPELHYMSFNDSQRYSPKDRFALVPVFPDLDYQEWLFKQLYRFREELEAARGEVESGQWE